MKAFSELGSQLWGLVRLQHGVVARHQLLALGLSPKSVEHRLANGRLHEVWRGVYAIGRPQLTQLGRWTAAVLSCGPDAVLSHEDAAALWRIRTTNAGAIHVSVPFHVARKRPGIVVHRRTNLAAEDRTRHRAIPLTSPVCTLIDFGARLPRDQLEAAVNEADKLGLTDPDELRSALDAMPRRPGIRALRELLGHDTFVLTDSELERRFLPIARTAGLPRPETATYLNGFKVDFHWPDLGLAVEVDGLRYHRTALQQARDRLRDQAHAAAGLTPLRFTYAQVRFERAYVRRPWPRSRAA